MYSSTSTPLARSQGLVIEELGDELLVYDLDSDGVHCLKPTAARVWRACDGTKSIEALAGELGLSSDEVHRALADLENSDLLLHPADVEVAGGNGGYSRRDFGVRVTKVAVAAASAPLIVSIAAPTAAQALTPCIAIELTHGCGDCNQGGQRTDCCCCLGGDDGGKGKGNDPFACAASAEECAEMGGTDCTET
jgi:Coenzyme PQQ synthesis protein D (PqqD)